ncbi:hypothetical protein A0H81_03253 [Grifola frondosa]|uniref:RNA polymerase II assembly factor Rtp1 C-terminal domain-containing protein n=1 Tax=Grifola frondosa TaxID=5627 RepID=A0A1C7MIB6_GRIFR|nr:hypothetical protein A0H81_03253 [Grifola frondosa]
MEHKQPLTLPDCLRAAAILTGSSLQEAPSDIKDVLRSRLNQYLKICGREQQHAHDISLEALQLETATEAISIVVQIQQCLETSYHSQASPGLSSSPDLQPGILFGSRDLSLLRILVSIVFKWAAEPLLLRIVAAIPAKPQPARSGAQIIDLTGLPNDYNTLLIILNQIFKILLPNGVQSPVAQTAVVATLLNLHLADIVKPCIVVGWLPRSLASESISTVDEFRPLIIRLLSLLPASQTITALGVVLSNAPSFPPFFRKACGFLLSRQLLRPEGLRGLCAAVFGEEENYGDEAPLDKLEHVSQLLRIVPAGMKPEEYYAVIIPRLVALLAVEDVSRRRFTNSRELVAGIVLPLLHNPILHGNRGSSSLIDTLTTIQTLLTNTDPSPLFISVLLSPIMPSLYSLSHYLDHTKISDPVIKELVKGFLATWGRVIGQPAGVKTFWDIVCGEVPEWGIDNSGSITVVEGHTQGTPSLSLFTPESLRQAEEAGDLDVDSNVLDLRPDPVHFVKYLKSIDRADISSELFVRILEAYKETKSNSQADPLRALLYLQLILQMQKQLSAEGSSNILSTPEHILSFIKHVLESSRPAVSDVRESQSRPNLGLRMEDLRIIPEEEHLGEDSDDEADQNANGGDDEMTVTAINLLLSVLEGGLEFDVFHADLSPLQSANPDLSARTNPILNEIFELLEPLTRDAPDELRPIAREARMVMTARLASGSAPPSKKAQKSSGTEDPQETYQKAQLVTARRNGSGGLQEPVVDPALVPAIRSIFLQSIQDDDSYMFLNAVQGLSAMVDGERGWECDKQQDVDTRTRIGEALAQVIRRCGDALPAYAGLVVPPLFQLVRTSHLPTVLRVSAISLLAQVAKTNSLAILPYAIDLSEAMIDLLQIESVPASQRHKPPPVDSGSEQEVVPPATMDFQPTSANSKFPPLRRAALHFLSLLVNACTTRLYESGDAGEFALPPRLVKRAKITLGYVSTTDEDTVVRVMARETLEGLDQLTEAIIGL